MRISAKDWAMYIARLSRLGKTAENMMREYIAEHGSEEIDRIWDFAFGLVTKYGEGAASLACEMYDALAKAQGAKVPPASPAYTARFWETKVAMKGTTDAEKPGAINRLVKRAGADTTLKNAIRDGAQFAWIPSGNENCAFCMAIAARGWQYASKKSLKNGHAEHIHPNCDCQYTVRFDQNSTVQGYDPDKYREMYDAAEGSTPQEKINSMRRELSKKVEKVEKPDIIKLPDILIHKSVGAKSRNYDVLDLETGEMWNLVEGEYLHDREVFCGKGTKKEYRDAWKFAQRYHEYGCSEEGWQHCKGIGLLDTEDGYRKAEIHWSHHDDIGDVEFFVKEWLDD